MVQSRAVTGLCSEGIQPVGHRDGCARPYERYRLELGGGRWVGSGDQKKANKEEVPSVPVFQAGAGVDRSCRQSTWERLFGWPENMQEMQTIGWVEWHDKEDLLFVWPLQSAPDTSLMSMCLSDRLWWMCTLEGSCRTLGCMLRKLWRCSSRCRDLYFLPSTRMLVFSTY